MDKIFDLPVEVVTSWARLLLACVALLSVVPNSLGAGNQSGLTLLLLGYIAFAIVIVLARASRSLSRQGAYGVHAVDVAVSSALMVLSSGVASPFFVFYQFALIAATLRWDWMGALVTAGILTLTLWMVYLTGISPPAEVIAPDSDNLGRTLIRGAFLMTGGAMLAYLGAHRERGGRRFAKLAAWPQIQPGESKIDLLERSLSHVADVMQAPRVLVIWDEADEPYRQMALWEGGQVRYSREDSTLFGDLVAPTHKHRPFAVVQEQGRGAAGNLFNKLVDRALIKTFAFTAVATAPFRYTACRGRIFVLDRTTAREEDLSLISVIASRIGVSLEDRILRDKLEASAIAQERSRLGRDLHDGVLQGLAAASIQLKVVSTTLPPEAQQPLRSIRDVLADEAQRIRTYVEANRAIAPSATGLVLLAPEVQKRIKRLRDLWGCEVELTVEPVDLNASLTTSRNVGHMIAEGVSNAVRHGRASRIQIQISKSETGLLLSIRDNGHGFENLSGSYDLNERSIGGNAPDSLKSRVEECGGTLYLSSSPQGTNLTVELRT
jgi:signal transduction histidine kinase